MNKFLETITPSIIKSIKFVFNIDRLLGFASKHDPWFFPTLREDLYIKRMAKKLTKSPNNDSNNKNDKEGMTKKGV